MNALRSHRQRWEDELAQVDEDKFEEPGTVGSWSMRDLVVHVTAYERGLVEWLEAAAQGKVKVFDDLDCPDVDHRNALILAQSAAVPLVDVRAQAERIFARLLELIDALPEGELSAAERTEWYVKPRWGQRRALWECIADDSTRHYDQHVAQVRRWLDREPEHDTA